MLCLDLCFVEDFIEENEKVGKSILCNMCISCSSRGAVVPSKVVSTVLREEGDIYWLHDVPHVVNVSGIKNETCSNQDLEQR